MRAAAAAAAAAAAVLPTPPRTAHTTPTHHPHLAHASPIRFSHRLPLARFYLAHALFNMQKLPEAQTALLGYLDDVAAAGPQRVLNMPDGWNGKKITEEDRKASRLRARAAAPEAVADAHTMLGLIAGGGAARGGGLGRAAELAATDRQRAEIANFRAEMLEKAGGLPPSNEEEKERANALLAEAAEQRGLAAGYGEGEGGRGGRGGEEEAVAAGDGESKAAAEESGGVGGGVADAARWGGRGGPAE